jgi:hypothetical protein
MREPLQELAIMRWLNNIFKKTLLHLYRKEDKQLR